MICLQKNTSKRKIAKDASLRLHIPTERPDTNHYKSFERSASKQPDCFKNGGANLILRCVRYRPQAMPLPVTAKAYIQNQLKRLSSVGSVDDVTNSHLTLLPVRNLFYSFGFLYRH